MSLLVIALVVIVGSVFSVAPAQAVSGSQFNAGRIIDDVVFFTANTMSSHEIKLFLNSKVPVCDTYHGSSDPANQPPFVCLKDYGQNTPSKAAEAGLCNSYPGGYLSAADIIYEVAKSCGINPQVLLVLLQKEQSLVTDTWPWATQYRSATGYGCPDTAPCDAEYYGFFNQVYMAARQFRYYAKNPTAFNYRMGRYNNIQFNPNGACGSSSVYIQNQATAGLYNYTPYQPNAAALNNLYGTGDGCSAYGNRNFWRLFNDWFGASVIGAAPSPLYKSSSTQQIFVIAGGKKYLVPSPEIMVNYGLQRFPAAEVSQSFLDQYSTADTLTSIGKKELDPSGALYLFDDGKRYPVDINDCARYPDGSSIPGTKWGLDCFNTSVSKTLTNELVDVYTVQDVQLPQMIINQNMVWKMEGGKRRLITDPVFVDVLGGWGKVRWMKDINALQPQGKMLIPDLSLVKFDNSPTLYYLADAQLRPVPSPDEISAWGLNSKPAYVFPASYNAPDPIPIGGALSTFAKNSSDTKYMLLTNGVKVPVTNASWQPASNQFAVLPDYVLNQLPTITQSQIFRSSSGTIFTVQAGNKYVFPTPEDIFFSGYRPDQIQPVSQVAENLLSYSGMKLSPGRLFKVTGSDTIRYVYGEGVSLSVNSTNIPGLPYSKLITVDSATGARYPILGSLN